MVSGIGIQIVGRFGRLESVDRLQLCLIALWVVAGVPGNYFRVHHPIPSVVPLFFFLWLGIITALAGSVVYSIAARIRAPGDYGFSFSRWGLLSVVLVVAVDGFLLVRGRLEPADLGSERIWSAVGAFMEEVGFRAIAINVLAVLLRDFKRRGLWAISASAVLFTIPHLVSKTPGLSAGIFAGSLVLGSVYYLSNSLVLPVWAHVSANAGSVAGGVAAIVCALLGFADRKFRPGKSGEAIKP